VDVSSRSLYAIARLSVVCNGCAPYSGGSNFRQYFYGIRTVVCAVGVLWSDGWMDQDETWYGA